MSNEEKSSRIHHRILVNILEIGNSDAFKKKVSKKLNKIQVEKQCSYPGVKHDIDGNHKPFRHSVLRVLVQTKGELLDCIWIHVNTLPLNDASVRVHASICSDPSINFFYDTEWNGNVSHCTADRCVAVSFQKRVPVWNDILDRIVDWIVIGRDRVRRGLSYE